MKRAAGVALMTAMVTVLSGAILDAPLHAASAGTPVAVRRYLLASASPLAGSGYAGQAPSKATADAVAAGASIFQQNCAFCHGRDTMGGESGPDLTRSKLVASDVKGDKIGEVLHNGRVEKGMPKFPFSDDQIASVSAFIHSQAAKAMSGKRRGVEVADLQSGNLEAGKQFFNGAGGCAKCHSPTGDLAGIASKYQGLQLEMHMLYPRDAKSTVSVTTASGQKSEGMLAYQDEFTIGLRDADGIFHSWPIAAVKYKVNSPVDAHVDLFPKYTDDDIHNLMAYIQTLK